MVGEYKPNPERLKPISLWPLKLKRALQLFVKVDPGKVKAAEKEEKGRRRRA